jgi:hypothetical protein
MPFAECGQKVYVVIGSGVVLEGVYVFELNDPKRAGRATGFCRVTFKNDTQSHHDVATSDVFKTREAADLDLRRRKMTPLEKAQEKVALAEQAKKDADAAFIAASAEVAQIKAAEEAAAKAKAEAAVPAAE